MKQERFTMKIIVFMMVAISIAPLSRGFTVESSREAVSLCSLCSLASGVVSCDSNVSSDMAMHSFRGKKRFLPTEVKRECVLLCWMIAHLYCKLL